MKKIKIDIKTLPTKILTKLSQLSRYKTFIFVLGFLIIYGFLVVRINILSRREPTEDAISQKLQSVQRPKIDQTALNKIQALQDQNVQVQALFKQARDNPFSE